MPQQVTSTDSKNSSNLPPPPNPNHWYEHTVQVITHMKTYVIHTIISLVGKCMREAVDIWFRWKGSPNPFKEDLQETPSVTIQVEGSKTVEKIAPTKAPKELPSFERDYFKALLKECPENKYLIIYQIEIQKNASFKTRFEFCRDLIIHAYNLSEERGYKGLLRVETASTEINLLFRYLGCSPFEGSNLEDLILTVNSDTLIAQTARLKKEASNYITQFKKAARDQALKSLRDHYYSLYETAKQLYLCQAPFVAPQDLLNPTTGIEVDGTLHLVQFSYDTTTNNSSISLKRINIEGLDEMDLRSQMLCYMKALCSFMTVSENSLGKIPPTAKRRVFAHSIQEAQYYALLGFVPINEKEVLSNHALFSVETKKIYKLAERAVGEQLKTFYLKFPEDQQRLVKALLKDVTSKNTLRKKWMSAPSDEQNIFYQVFRLLIKAIVEKYFNETKAVQESYRKALKDSLSSLDFTIPQEFVPRTDKEEELWTHAGNPPFRDLTEHFECLIEAERLYQAKMKERKMPQAE